MKHYWIYGLIWMISLLLVACGRGSNTLEPPTIYYGEDICDQCGMIISDERFAAATIVEIEEGITESRIFDDIGDMLLYHAAYPELKVLAWYVHDYETKEWIDAREAFYVHSSAVHTPMGHGIAAFKTQEQARQMAEAHQGQVLAFDELTQMVQDSSFENVHRDAHMD